VGNVVVTDLGTLGGAQSTALDINDSDQIVGWSATAQGVKHAFEFSNGMMDDIGMAFGPNGISEAAGINASGVIAGTMSDQFGTIGFVWNAGGVDWLHGPGINNVEATHGLAINDNGNVAGYVESSVAPGAASKVDALLWAGSRIVKLRVHAIANDVNPSQFAVGRDDAVTHALVWQFAPLGLIVTQNLVPGLGSATGNFDALGVNARGDVVGYAPVFGSASNVVSHAYLWDGFAGVPQDLGVFPLGSNSVAEDINQGRFVAGHADERVFKGPIAITHELAFLWHSNFGLVALPALPATTWLGSCRAYALNELKASMHLEVVGACDVPGAVHAVVWDVTIQSVPIYFP
jgi:probable HAF family extracellular repeat protein